MGESLIQRRRVEDEGLRGLTCKQLLRTDPRFDLVEDEASESLILPAS